MTLDKRLAKVQVEAFLEALSLETGVGNEEVRELLEDIRWVRKYRRAAARAGWAAALAIAAAIAVAFASALWLGVITLISDALHVK